MNKRHLSNTFGKHMFISMDVSMVGCLWRPEKGMGSLEAGDTGGCALPGVGAGNQTPVFYQSSKLS